MNNYNPLLLIDFYKATHHEQYPKGLTKMVSYYTPRMSRLNDVDHVTFFGLQGFIDEYLIGAFRTWFFDRDLTEVLAEYNRVMTYTLGPGSYSTQKLMDLHKLGYLPLEIRAVPEGTRTKIGVPQIEISNTDPKFVWLVNTIETMLSSTMWHTQVAAEVGYRYRKIVDKWVEKTCDSTVSPWKLIGDFSMRGQHSVESAIKSSAGWLLSHHNTATVPAIMWMEQHYACDMEKEPVGFGAISTEHSVMCSNFAVDGDEVTHIKRLLTETYPELSFSMVSDSYDYWNLVTKILPQCKEEIMNHKGYLAIRGDSGDPVEVIAGIDIAWLKPYDDEEAEKLFVDKEYTHEWLYDYCRDKNIEEEIALHFNYNDKFYKVSVYPDWSCERGGMTDSKYFFVDNYSFNWQEFEPHAEMMGTVWALDQIFGHTVNCKGYKVLPPYIKAIYGDSITPQRCEEIYKRLAAMGYAINNVSLGAGSFSFMCLETIDEDGAHYNPYTRDTFGIAVKATYAEDSEGNGINIFKKPKALEWKKSQKGCCVVVPDGESYTDGHAFEDTFTEENLMFTVFKDGKIYGRQHLSEIRDRLHGG